MLFFLLLVLIVIIVLIVTSLWRRRRARRQREKHIGQLVMWATENESMDPVLQKWIQRLTVEEAEVLFTLLDGYCTTLNWQLDWLFAPQIKKAPELKAALEESVNAYGRAMLLSLQMERDVQAYKAYLAFEKKPTARQQKAIVARLYTRINSAGLTPPGKRFLGRFSRKEANHSQQVQAIQNAFEKNPAKTMQLLKEVLSTSATVLIQPEREEPTVPVLTAPVELAA